jgi:hypothetical protein
MSPNQIIWAVLKPALKRKFKFKDLHKVNFVADRINDELNLTCTGLDKEDILRVQKCEPMILSENKHYIDMFDSQVKEQLNFKQIDISILDINFLESSCKSDIYYIDVNGEKKNQKIPLKF